MTETTNLRYFREIASAGSLRQAAERLFVAPSALSRHVIALEQELGVALFERRARGMTLTDAGRLLLGYANDSQERFEALRADIHQFEVLQRGKVDIACVEGLLSSIMPAFVEGFLAAYGGVSLTVAAMGSRAVADAVAEHRVDLGIVFGQPPRHDLVELARMSQPLCAIVSPQHPLARRRKCRLVDAAAYPLVLPDRSFGIRQMIDLEAGLADGLRDVPAPRFSARRGRRATPGRRSSRRSLVAFHARDAGGQCFANAVGGGRECDRSLEAADGRRIFEVAQACFAAARVGPAPGRLKLSRRSRNENAPVPN